MKTPLFQIPEDFAALSDDELRSFIDSSAEVAKKVAEAPKDFVSEERDSAALMSEMTAGVAAIAEAREALKARGEASTEETPAEVEIDAEALAELAARATAEEAETPEAVEEAVEEPEEPVVASADEDAVTKVVATIDPEALTQVIEKTAEKVAEAMTASAKEAEEKEAAKPLRLARPSRSTSVEESTEGAVSFVASAENLGPRLGEDVDKLEIGRMMIDLRRRVGDVPEGTHGDREPVAKADWTESYPEERRLGRDIVVNMDRIEAVTAAAGIRAEFEKRLKDAGSLTASGGLCAPVTPYYSLQMVSVADRPVRAALPSFNADRGGINAARPAALTAIDDAVGIITEAEDAAGGASATKSCQVIDCPSFVEVDVSTIYHCLQFGNLGARTFPELVSQWNDLVLAAHARTAETALLDGIRSVATHVTAANTMDLGASAQLPSQILTAAAGMRSRHRMAPDTVLRVLLPDWVLDLLVSDVYRSQFGRFDMTPERFVALLRQGNVEPTFHLDGRTGGSQIFGAQAAAALSTFPSVVEWYLYPEGSFIYLDGGTLELGLVRDSVLNATNDFQIFGETFENIAFVGVEALAVVSTLEDTGAVTAPNDANSVSY